MDAEKSGFVQDKNPKYLNGYKGGKYQVLITSFNPDDDTIYSLLNNSKNRILFPKKKKGSSQRGPGNKVPSHLNDSPFAISIPQKSDFDNSFDKKTSKNADSGRRSALSDDYYEARGREACASPLIGIDERYDLAKQLWREVKTDEERNLLSWYEGELLKMETKLLDRSELLREHKKVKDEIFNTLLNTGDWILAILHFSVVEKSRVKE